ncbi:hypothetical protein ALMP_49810 [Streptomyces sp. A012304]|nr:hypothetical protein ALMP_49810 [Streptomyces sp. A012304]
MGPLVPRDSASRGPVRPSPNLLTWAKARPPPERSGRPKFTTSSAERSPEGKNSRLTPSWPKPLMGPAEKPGHAPDASYLKAVPQAPVGRLTSSTGDQ